MSPTFFRKAFPLCVLSIFAGCATGGGYEVVGPAEAQGPVSAEAGRTLARDGVDYEIVRADDRLVVHFVNRTDGPIRITGESALVDARGRAFAVPVQTVGKGASGRVFAPPAFADAALRGERRPIAGETRVGGIDEGGILPRRDDGSYRQDPDERRFDWPRGANVRLVLVFAADGKTFTHAWVLRRT